MISELKTPGVYINEVNAIRFFNGPGILVWGARTLDGNSMDWCYISVRRTVTMIEQTCKLATREFVFEPNDVNAWTSIEHVFNDFLTGIWKQGG